MTAKEEKPQPVMPDVPRPDPGTIDGLFKKGYSPPPVAHVERPKPPAAGPRLRPAENSQPSTEQGEAGR